MQSPALSAVSISDANSPTVRNMRSDSHNSSGALAVGLSGNALCIVPQNYQLLGLHGIRQPLQPAVQFCYLLSKVRKGFRSRSAPAIQSSTSCLSYPETILCAESERVILLHICQPLTSARSCYCQLPVSGRNMQRLLQFRLGCHKLPIATGRVTGVARA